jgi:maltose-binding protein MalE
MVQAFFKKFFTGLNRLKYGILLITLGLGLTACGLSTPTPLPPDYPTSTPLPPTGGPSEPPVVPTARPTPTTNRPTVVPTPTALPTPQGEIVLWEQLPANQSAFLKTKIEAFQKLYPEVTVTLRHFDNDDLKAKLAQAETNKPALIVASTQNSDEWRQTGYILPVDSLFDKKFLDSFALNLMRVLQAGGETRGIPYSWGDTLLLYYNKKLISADKIPDSWQGMTDFVRANPAKRGEFYPFTADLYDPFLLLAALDAYGGTVLGPDNQPRLNTEPMRQALQFLQDAVYKNKVVPLDPNFPQMQLLFNLGQLALVIDRAENLSGYLDHQSNKLELGVTRLPQLNGKTLNPPATGLAYFIGSSVKDQGAQLAAVKAFITFMTNIEQQRDRFTQLKQLPVTRAGLNDPLVKKDPIFSAIAGQLPNSPVIPSSREWRAVLAAFPQPISAVIADRASAAEGAAALQDLTVKNLKS